MSMSKSIKTRCERMRKCYGLYLDAIHRLQSDLAAACSAPASDEALHRLAELRFAVADSGSVRHLEDSLEAIERRIIELRKQGFYTELEPTFLASDLKSDSVVHEWIESRQAWGRAFIPAADLERSEAGRRVLAMLRSRGIDLPTGPRILTSSQPSALVEGKLVVVFPAAVPRLERLNRHNSQWHAEPNAIVSGEDIVHLTRREKENQDAIRERIERERRERELAEAAAGGDRE